MNSFKNCGQNKLGPVVYAATLAHINKYFCRDEFQRQKYFIGANGGDHQLQNNSGNQGKRIICIASQFADKFVCVQCFKNAKE